MKQKGPALTFDFDITGSRVAQGSNAVKNKTYHSCTGLTSFSPGLKKPFICGGKSTTEGASRRFDETRRPPATRDGRARLNSTPLHPA
jgi:hypothetical protein